MADYCYWPHLSLAQESRLKRMPGNKPAFCPVLNWPAKHEPDLLARASASLSQSLGEKRNGWSNRLYLGDNLEILKLLARDFAGQVQLVYLDPPFCSGHAYRNSPNRNLPAPAEIQFRDHWQRQDYLQFIYERLFVVHGLLAPGGVAYIHCDHRANWLIRALGEEIFGPGRLINELIWHYTGGGRSRRYFAHKHDTILVFARTGKYIFNADSVRVPYSEGSRYARTGIRSQSGKRYRPNPAGKIPDDVWDIPIINPLASERCGYPTQKPLELLKRIILASSNPGDLVLDCFMGSGTTLVAARDLQRRFIGADCNPVAVQITLRRLGNPAEGPGLEIYTCR